MISKFPIYKQHDAKDCGATCLKIITKHYGKFYSLNSLTELTNSTTEGASLLDISEGAEKIGFHTFASKIPYEKMTKDVPLPLIAHWQDNHFVVVYHITEKNVWVADPALGHIKMTRKEFLEGWISDDSDDKAGIVLLLEPGPDFFAKEGEKTDKRKLSQVFNYLHRYKQLIIQLLLGLFVATFLMIVFPFFLQAIVDEGIKTQDIHLVALIMIAWIILFLSQMAIEYIRGYILLHIGQRVNISLLSDFLIRITKQPIGYFDGKTIGDLLQRIYDNERIERFLTSTVLNSIFSILSIVILGIVLVFFDKTIFFVFFLATALYFLWVLYFTKRRKILDYKRFEEAADNHNRLTEMIMGMKDIRLHNAETKTRWRWERSEAKLYQAGTAYLATNEKQHAGAKIINEIKNIFILAMSADAVIKGTMSMGEMFAIQYIMGQLNAPVKQLITFLHAAQDAQISTERMSEIYAKDNNLTQGTINVVPENQDIIVENASFQYDGKNSPMVLKKINLVIPHGKTTAIVGSSGSGKSTLIKLLLNFYPVTEGSIKIGDVTIKNIQGKIWNKHCGAVLEDGYLFSDTIANNIALSDQEKIDKEKVRQAVKMVELHHFVEALPKGYNTIIGDEGLGLSQGQKQRILIAREIYKNPEILFLDEATNTLDAYTEIIVLENLEEYFDNKTIVTVAHRANTAINADNIIVLEKGQVIEQGTHHQLTLKRGAYYHLIKNQLQGC